eukprot:242882-Rhodomonas_salina.3
MWPFECFLPFGRAPLRRVPAAKVDSDHPGPRPVDFSGAQSTWQHSTGQYRTSRSSRQMHSSIAKISTGHRVADSTYDDSLRQYRQTHGTIGYVSAGHRVANA